MAFIAQHVIWHGIPVSINITLILVSIMMGFSCSKHYLCRIGRLILISRFQECKLFLWEFNEITYLHKLTSLNEVVPFLVKPKLNGDINVSIHNAWIYFDLLWSKLGYHLERFWFVNFAAISAVEIPAISAVEINGFLRKTNSTSSLASEMFSRYIWLPVST